MEKPETDSKIIAGLIAIPELLALLAEINSRVAAIEGKLNALPLPPRQSLKRFYNSKETAEALGVCAETVRRLKKRGLLNTSKGTSRLLFPVEEIERYKKQTV